MDFGNSYFSTLPIEMIEQILLNLSAIDINSFLEVYPQCAQIPANFTNLDLSKCYELVDLNRFLEKRYFRSENIVTLNLNYIYWIPAVDLRNFLLNFINLKNLYAIQTNLRLDRENINVFNRVKLEKLAITNRVCTGGKDYNDIAGCVLPSLKTLYLYCPNKRPFKVEIRILVHYVFTNIKYIWICDFKNLKRRSYCIEAKGVKMSKYGTMSFADINNRFHKDSIMSTNPHWNKLLAYDGFNSIFYYKDIKTIKSGETPFDLMHLQELALININYVSNGPREHETELIKLTQQILLTPQVKRLVKLSVFACFLYTDEKPNNDNNNSIGKLIFQNLSGLQVIEIAYHNYCRDFLNNYSSSIWKEYHFIAECKNLKRLKMNLASGDDFFLTKIFSECTLLEQFIFDFNYLFSYIVESFMSATGIGHCKNLKDFTYITPMMTQDHFRYVLDELRLRNLKSLKRIVISIPEDFKFEKRNMAILRFLKHYPQIIFFHLNCKNIAPSKSKRITDWLKRFQTHPAQVFSVGHKSTVHPHMFDLRHDLNTVAASTRIDDFYKCID